MKLLIKISALSFVCVALLAVVVIAGDDPAVVTTPREAFTSGAFVIKGEGVAPSSKGYSSGKKRLMAIRAAKAAALRELSETLNSVRVSGVSNLSVASKESNDVAIAVRGFVRGASVIKEDYNSKTEVATVFVSLAVTGVDGVLGSLTAKVVPTLSSSDKFVGSPNYGDLPVDDEGDIDGLIVDVTKKDFTPAIVNRIIVVSGGVVYGPQKIAQAVLVKKGAAEYTTEIGKAKAVLKERGIVNPLIITAESVKDGTDVVISQSDAELISVYNNRESFLESADVVFVLE